MVCSHKDKTFDRTCSNKDSLYAVVVRPADDWVGRNVVTREKPARLRTESSSAMSEATGGWSIVRNSHRLGRRR